MKGKYILWIVVVLLLIGIGTGVYLWNKPHNKVEDQEGIALTVDALNAAYAANEANANQQYLNKALMVTGTVSETATNQDGGTVLTLSGATPGGNGVLCTMRDKGVQATQGATVTVKGFCTGSDLFGVTLTDCILK